MAATSRDAASSTPPPPAEQLLVCCRARGSRAPPRGLEPLLPLSCDGLDGDGLDDGDDCAPPPERWLVYERAEDVRRVITALHCAPPDGDASDGGARSPPSSAASPVARAAAAGLADEARII